MDSINLSLILISAIIVITGFTLIMVYFFLKQDYKRRRLEIIGKDNAEILKLRFLAYERLALLLERLSPESLVIREQRHDMNSLEFHSMLLKIIRQEFNHNIAMQIYVSNTTWEKIKDVREKLIKLINTAATATNPNDPALELGKNIIEDANNDIKFYFKDALTSIRTEIESYYKS